MAMVKHVRPGDKLLLCRRGDMMPDGHYDEIIERWTVIDVYPHHVLCECDGIRESFTFGELVQMGLEKSETGSEMGAVDGFHWGEHKRDKVVE